MMPEHIDFEDSWFFLGRDSLMVHLHRGCDGGGVVIENLTSLSPAAVIIEV